MFRGSSVFLLTVAALVSIVTPLPVNDVSENDIASLCPELFRYEDRDTPGKWSGNLAVRYSEDLNGLWIRLLFDNQVSDVQVDVS